jgi:nitrate reductase delta subunit
VNPFNTRPQKAPYTLRVLAHVLRYPNADLRTHIPEMQQALKAEQALAPMRLAELGAMLKHLQRTPALEIESEYVELFDRGRRTALHLFEHVHGDSRDRGPAMIDLIQTYEKGGLYMDAEELPDYLPVVLEFASTQPPEQARDFLAEIAHIVRNIFSALQSQGSPYASVLAAVLELAGEKAQTVPLAPEPAIDESWTEPPVFGGCSTEGQAKPGQAQPIQIVRKPSPLSQGVRP